jgi:hypothetical protein
MGSYTARPIHVGSFRESRRAELVFRGVEQAGASFEGRVFLDNPDANEATLKTAGNGYAGSFHVYGYGDHPPPALAAQKMRRGAAGPAVAPIEKRVNVDAAVLRTALERSDELTVTVVPVPADPGGPVPERPFETVEVVFDRG